MITKPGRARRGTTLIELCVVLAVSSLLAVVAMGRLHAVTDRSAARGAIQEIGALFSLARRSALTRRAPVAVVIDTVARLVVVRVRGRVLASRAVGAQYRVGLATTRDSMVYDPRGLGFGAANLSVIVKRAQASETLFVSRLGRTRH